MLAINRLTASIDGKEILTDLSLLFEAGKTYAVIGQNGSGKSTLAGAVLGRPDIVLGEHADIRFNDESLLPLSPEKRARLGIFLSFQNPPALPGVSLFSLLRAARPEDDALETKRRIETLSNELGIPESLRSRGLHDGFSGGEKKKFEALLWALLSPKLALFDELDTGVDVDAIQTIGAFIRKHRTPEQTLVFITHSTALLDIIPPDQTLVIKNGTVERTGDGSLARRIIKEEGFERK